MSGVGIPVRTACRRAIARFARVNRPYTRPANSPSPTATRKVDAEAKARYDTQLWKRAEAGLASGSSIRLKLTRPSCRARLKRVESGGKLVFESLQPRFEMSLGVDKLTDTDKRNLALAMLRDGNPGDHALVGFYSLAIGDRQTASVHLAKAEDLAGPVRDAFE